MSNDELITSVYSKYVGHVYSGHSDKVATFWYKTHVHVFHYIERILWPIGYSGQKGVAQGGHYI